MILRRVPHRELCSSSHSKPAAEADSQREQHVRPQYTEASLDQ